MNRAAGAFALILLSGCARDFAWKPVVTTTTGGRWAFQWRDKDELWGFGGDAIRRTRQDWEVFSVCPDGMSATQGAFEPDGSMWVLCADGLAQGAVRYDVAQQGTTVELPIDGEVMLVQLDDEVLVIGETQLWAFDGAAWTSLATHPFGTSLLQVAGQGRDSIFATHSINESYGGYTFGNIAAEHFDGVAWSPLVLPDLETALDPSTTAFPLALTELAWFPADEAWYLGPWRLDGATAVLDDEWVLPSARASWFTRDHELVFAIPGGNALYSDTHDDLLWVVGPNDVRADEFLGTGPWSTDPQYHNCSFLGGTVFAVTRDQLLAEVCSSDGTQVVLMEGRR